MIVSVDLASTVPDVRLDAPDDCKRFHVAVHGEADLDRLARVLADTDCGRLDGDDVWVPIEAVRRMAVGHVGPSWESDFAAMLDFARGKGWLDASGTAIRAHVEWS